jgi:7-keto-8-aminopelargonate synthetase-like enzyme
VPDNLHDKGNTTVDLDIHVATINGMLVWGRGGGGFSKKCKNIRLKGVILIASCPVNLGGSGGAGGYIDAELDLNDHFAFSCNGFQPNIPDTEFEAFISAASWMNLTVISEANMSMFLQHPAFQKAVSSIVRRAVVSNLQTLAVVQQMVQKLETINKSSEEYISHQMGAFVKSAVASSAAYATMSQLTTMMAGSKERTTFDAFIETTHHSTASAGEITYGGPSLSIRTGSSLESNL